MDESLLNLIFESKLLDTREKWLIVRQIKQGKLSPSQIDQVVIQLKKEDEVIERARAELDSNYLSDLKEWSADLEGLYHEHVVKGRKETSEKQHQEDEKVADELLKKL